MAYIKTNTSATAMSSVSNWSEVGRAWTNSLSIGMGYIEGNASFSRSLTQLALAPRNRNFSDPDVDLDPVLPSLAEALAILVSDSVVLSLKDSPFVEYFPGLVTDYSQPPQLFAQAVNSPPARELAGSCGSGPEGKQYKLGWLISHEGGHLYIEPGPSECSALLTDEHKSGHVKSDTRVVDRAVGPSGEVNLTVGTELLHQSSTARSIGSLSPDDELGQAKGRTWDSFAKLSKKRILL
ncbi:hypothetical protein N0V91_009614 [Didymella pomorum]|uniref:Uncharacterized protein n=1 Tax=Didymella pomorum TaxID=749634 RepID=A0A9W9D2W3_9PLEO|nr:hypothetical protein N0V91_009614 [Didymella pomorum]